MLIFNASKKANAVEEAMTAHLQPLAGFMLANAKIPRRSGRPREVDGIVLTPHRAFVVEAKGFRPKTANSGVLEVPLNGDWMIGGKVASFYGDDWPSVQARQSSQAFAGFLKENTTVKAYVTGVACITADRAVMAHGPVQVQDVMVCKDHDLLDAIEKMPLLGRNKPITVEHVFEVLRGFGILESQWPARADVEAEWAKAAAQAPTGRATQTSGPTFDEIMADFRARRSNDPREGTKRVMRKLGVPYPSEHSGTNGVALRPESSDISDSVQQTTHAQQDTQPETTQAAQPKRSGAWVFWLVVAAVSAVGLVNKFVLSPDTGDMEDAFEAALAQAYPDAAQTLVASSLTCTEHEGEYETLFYCGILTRDSDDQRWRYEAFASEPKFLTPDDVSREIADLGQSTEQAEGAESEALSVFRTEFPAKAKKITREYVECKQGADDGYWPFKTATFDCFGFDGTAGDQRYRYEVDIKGNDPTDFEIGTVTRTRDKS